MEIEFVDNLQLPLTSGSLSHALALLSDSSAPAICLQLVLSGKVKDVAMIKDVIAEGYERGMRELGGIIAKVNDSKEDEILRSVGEKGDTLKAYLGLEELRQRLDTWEIISPPPQSKSAPILGTSSSEVEFEVGKSEPGDMDIDDLWSEDKSTEETEKTKTTLLDDPWTSGSPISPESPLTTIATSSQLVVSPEQQELPFNLLEFLSRPLLLSALDLASAASLSSLRVICQRHHESIYPYRLGLLETVPEWVPPSELESQGLLPGLRDDFSERWLSPLDASLDIRPSNPPILVKTFAPSYFQSIPSTISPTPHTNPLTGTDLSKWYTSHILSLDALGNIDIQFAWVQHGASQGVPDLDALGEDLSLLSRLVYDANLTPQQHAYWNLSTWMEAKEHDIIHAYLANSTPQSVTRDIKSLVMPYLYMLESRTERAGKPSSSITNDLLNFSILSLPLQLALPVFEASKATLPHSERIIKNDLDVARLALACLYGSQERGSDVWSIMSSVFECLPVWELTGEDAEDEELTSTTLDSISTFVRPTSASMPPPSKQDLLLFFHPLPFASLSRALDILDVQLESGEILARWGVEIRLGELLGVTGDRQAQKELAEKLVRAGGTLLKGENEDRWRKLWEDTQRLASGQGLLKGALGRLSLRERGRAFLGAILRLGRFDIARRMVKRLEHDGAVGATIIENVVLEVSKEFYISAESVNIHTGDMKLAYDCLSVSPASETIKNEKRYIEATSRLSSFSRFNLTPVEVRHTQDPLSLISTIISGSSSDAYKHADLMLDLTRKIGCQGVIEEGLVWGMMGRMAVQNEDWEVAKVAIGNMLEIVKKRKKPAKDSNQPQSRNTPDANKARLLTEAYTLAHDLASQPNYPDFPAKLSFITSALELCPTSSIPSILQTFKEVEKGRVKLDEAAKQRRDQRISAPLLPIETTPTSVAVGAIQQTVLGSRTAAKAAKLALDLGGRLTHRPIGSSSLLSAATLGSAFGTHGPSRPVSQNSIKVDNEGSSDAGYMVGTPTTGGARELFEGLGRDEAEKVRKGARRAIVRGVGWLLGAEEDDITGVEE
ncbi:hypothetical protein L204_105644 [Cryptococcus depauperatus]|nr:hypothetical protein L204_02588 [Cryptococcus depauperatus CBS 7855]